MHPTPVLKKQLQIIENRSKNAVKNTKTITFHVLLFFASQKSDTQKISTNLSTTSMKSTYRSDYETHTAQHITHSTESGQDEIKPAARPRHWCKNASKIKKCKICLFTTQICINWLSSKSAPAKIHLNATEHIFPQLSLNQCAAISHFFLDFWHYDQMLHIVLCQMQEKMQNTENVLIQLKKTNYIVTPFQNGKKHLMARQSGKLSIQNA